MNFNFSRLLPFVIKLWVSISFFWLLIIVWKIVASRVKNYVSNNDIDTWAYNVRLWETIGDVTYRWIVTFSVMVFFEMMGINIWFLIAWLTFGIWYAIKEILGNMFAWIMILTNKKFTIGDIVQFEWALNYFGKITEITIRHTIVQTFDHRKVIVPNIILVQNFVKTFSTEDTIKTSISIGLGFQSDPDEVCLWIKEYLDSKDYIVQKQATKVLIENIYHSGYTITMYFYMKPVWKQGILIARSEIQKELLELYDKRWRVYPWDHIQLSSESWSLPIHLPLQSL